MRKNLITFLGILCVLSFTLFFSCNKTDVPKIQAADGISEEQAREVFANGRVEIVRKFSKDYLIMPRYGTANDVSFGAKHNAKYIPLGYNANTGNYLQMIIMKDEGRVRSLLIEMQPDSTWLKSNHDLENYKSITGNLIFYSANGRFFQGYKMVDGAKVEDYFPPSSLSSLPALHNLNTIVASNSTEPCVDAWGSFGCEELQEVVVVARSPGQTSNTVYIYIPYNVYQSAPSGGTYNGYIWQPLAGNSVPLSPSPGGYFAAPGDRICPSSFAFTGSVLGSFWNTNMTGMRFENGTNVNNFPSVKFALNNGITDAAMNAVPSNDFFARGETRLEYLQDLFGNLFPNNIYSTTVNGQTIWHFTSYAAGKIASYASNLAALTVVTQYGQSAALPNFQAPRDLFYNRATTILGTFIAGSTVAQGNIPSAGTSIANYGTTCQ